MYLTNVEALARKFIDEKRDALGRLRDGAGAGGFRAFWAALEPKRRGALAAAPGEAILKARRPLHFTVTSKLCTPLRSGHLQGGNFGQSLSDRVEGYYCRALS